MIRCKRLAYPTVPYPGYDNFFFASTSTVRSTRPQFFGRFLVPGERGETEFRVLRVRVRFAARFRGEIGGGFFWVVGGWVGGWVGG